MKTIAVIGAGITGTTTAYALALRGFNVTLFEQHRYAAMETSYANGGQLSASNAEVWNSPATVWKGLKWMLKSDAPLLVNPKPSWHKASWFVEFLLNLGNYEKNTIATARLAVQAREHFFAWAQAEGIDFDLEKRGILHIYRTKREFDSAGKVSKLLATGGLPRRAVTPEEMRAIEPTLAGQYHGGYFTESDSTGDIHKYSNGIAAAAARRGVKTLYSQEVLRLSSDGKRAKVIVRTHDDGIEGEEMLDFDGLVVCAGVKSRAFAAQLGDRVNIYPVKGYSITVDLQDDASRAAAPYVSLLDDATKIVSSRLGPNRFRVAGTAEYNGYNKDIRAARIRPLVDWVNDCFPGVSTRQYASWTGLRPMMPDMMPRVGRGRKANVFYNTGHGHLGWTLCAVTADMIAGTVQQASA